jgi:hypothetical protein
MEIQELAFYERAIDAAFARYEGHGKGCPGQVQRRLMNATTCPQCGGKKDRRAVLCRTCQPGRAPRGPTGRKVQFWLSGPELAMLEALGGDTWAKTAVLAALKDGPQ